jgi:hypothetical protein
MGAVEPHHVVSSCHRWQAVDNLVVTTAELYGNLAVGRFLRGDNVEGVRIPRIIFVIAIGALIDQNPSTGTSLTLRL